MSSYNKLYGSQGEQAAARYLTAQGYQITELNWRCEVGEVDIIARDGSTIVFVEVKTRLSLKYGYPSEAVDAAKRRKLSMLAAQYIKQNGLVGKPARFDVVEVLGGSLRHIRNAFDSTISF